MREDERIWAMKEILSDYVKSPSLRHIRDPHSLTTLVQDFVKRINQGNSIWRKWNGQREVVQTGPFRPQADPCDIIWNARKAPPSRARKPVPRYPP
jgi:hypothetical protein